MQVYYLEFLVVALGLAMLMIDAFAKLEDKRSIAHLGILGLSIVFLLLFLVKTPDSTDSAAWKFYAAPDNFSLFFKGIAVLSTIISLVMAIDFAPAVSARIAPPAPGAHPQSGLSEFFALPVFICAGLMWMASANNLVSIFVSIEVVSITFYIMVSYMRRKTGSLEAGVKYLILGSLSTGFLIYGFAWLYGATGSLELPKIAAALALPETNATAAMFAFALFLISLAFKLGASPFHFWMPDVYQGAPTPITAFLSVGSKAGAVIVTWRLVEPFIAAPALQGKAIAILTVVAILTLLIGNLGALAQKNFKRLLAYSSISHSGFILMAIASAPIVAGATTLQPGPAIAYYTGAYLLMTLLAFHVLCVVSSDDASEDLDSFRGLSKRSPFLAAILLIAMASLAGVPLTTGFFGKLLAFKMAIDAQQWLLLVAAIIGAGAGFYFYLKIAVSMYFTDTNGKTNDSPIPISPLSRVIMILTAIMVILAGIAPGVIVGLFS